MHGRRLRAHVAVRGSVGLFVLWQVLVGLGNGLVLATLSTAVVTRAPVAAVAISSGLFSTSRTVGAAVTGTACAAVRSISVVRPAAPRSPSPPRPAS